MIAAAIQLRKEFRDAKRGNYYKQGWYSYMNRTDIEQLVDYILGPDEEEVS